jgi:DNA-binding response OmpR family regulator
LRFFLRELLSAAYSTTATSVPGIVVDELELNDVDAVILGTTRFGVSSMLHVIRSKQSGTDVSVIVLCEGDGATRAKYLTNGASDVLSKPFHPEELRLRLQQEMQS